MKLIKHETGQVAQQEGTLASLARALRHDEDAEQIETAELAEDLLMELGMVAEAEILPETEPGESSREYLERVWEDLPEITQARVEVAGIGQIISLTRAGEKALQRRLYKQFVSGTWEAYARDVPPEC